MNFNCYMPTRVVSGEGCLTKNAALLKTLGSRALVVTGKHAAKESGALDDLKTALTDCGISFVQFDRICANPLLTTCWEGGKLARSEGCDFVVTVGGGSVQDAGKAIAVFAVNGIAPTEIFDYANWNGALKIAAIGTTAGTGSEVTAVSVLTCEDGRKRSIKHPAVYPTLAFADARYTASCGKDLTFSAAVDAVCHAAEAYFSAAAGEYSDGCAVQALRKILPALSACADNGIFTPEIRRDLYEGSLWAGLALNACGTCFPHPLGYVLTERFGIPHGFACGVFLPAFLKRAGRFLPEKAERFGQATGYPTDELAGLIGRLTAALDYHWTPELIGATADRFDGAGNMLRTPGGLNRTEITEILKSMK